MAHAHESNTKRIWIVFGILSFITIVEVYLGILKPAALHLQGMGTSWLKKEKKNGLDALLCGLPSF